jgi:hypothetical protein
MLKSPPLAPDESYHRATVYIVMDDFGQPGGRAYRKTDEFDADERTTIDNFLSGQKYLRPVRVVAFNTDDHSSWDVSEDIAHAVAECATREGRQLSEGTRHFLEEHLTQAEMPVVWR